jgi:hydrogenase maturation protein HypF
MALERRATCWLKQNPNFDQRWESLDLRPIVTDLCDIDPDDEEAVGRGAAAFHLTLANGLAWSAINAAHEQGIVDVVLSGGCFMNRLLRLYLSRTLASAGLRVHLLPAAACGDAGLALGQAWVAACTLAEDLAPENY